MIDLTTSTIDHIEKAALASFPNETCGFILADGSFKQVPNVADDPSRSFKIDAVDRASNLDAIAIVHTHCVTKYRPIDPRTPSVADINSQRKTGLPWLIFAVTGRELDRNPVTLPTIRSKSYLNRPFIAGITDCYTLVQDWYHFERGITLPEPIPYTTNWLLSSPSQMSHMASEYGFVPVKSNDLADGDVLILNSGAMANHLGIYTQGKVLHQSTLSMVEPFENFIGNIVGALRYAG